MPVTRAIPTNVYASGGSIYGTYQVVTAAGAVYGVDVLGTDPFAVKEAICAAVLADHGVTIDPVELTVMGGSSVDQTPTTLVDGATITWDFDVDSLSAKVTLAGSRTLQCTLTNLPEGAVVTLTVTQDGTGGRDLTFDTGSFAGLIRGPFLAAGAITVYQFRYNGSRLLPLSDMAWRTKIVAEGALPYALTASDYRTRIIYTGTTNGEIDLIAMTRDFEFSATQQDTGVLTFDPNGAEVIFWDPSAAAGSSTFVFPGQFSTACLFTDGANGWYLT